MIFVTVGTQLSFPRLIDAVDALAPGLEDDVIAQVGPDSGGWSNIELAASLTPDRFEATFTTARLIVAHAGIGTILSAKRFKKPLILAPRRHALGEHRNDHQLATAKAVENLTGIYIAWEMDDLAALVRRTDLVAADDQPSATLSRLTGRLRRFIDEA